jgi:hypothetical protein
MVWCNHFFCGIVSDLVYSVGVLVKEIFRARVSIYV